MKEKILEKWIARYLKLKWAIVEQMQSWKILIKKWKYNHRMTLQSEWCPDIFCFYQWTFIWIEVKKNQKEVDDWIQIEKRYYWEWKPLPEPYYNKKDELCDSYKREKEQIKYKERIIENGWTHIITCDIDEVILFIENIEKWN